MSLIRDLWNDPDPIKWVIFGGLGVSLIFSGALYWQNGKLTELKDAIALHEKQPRTANDPAPKDSLQQFLERADQLAGYMKQIQDDPFSNLEEDPANYASQYVVKRSTPAGCKDPKVSVNVKGGGTSYTDTEINVSFLNNFTLYRDNIHKFLYNMELSPLVVTTFFTWTPAERNHRPGQVLPADGTDQWIFESKFTVRRPKITTPAVK